jgi:hypothetical protein
MAETDPKPLRVQRVPEGVVLTFNGWERTVITYDRAEIDRLLHEVTLQPVQQDRFIPRRRRVRGA